MDHIDYLYVRIKMEEMLERLGESEAIALNAGAHAAAPAQPAVRTPLLVRVRRFFRLRRRSIRVLPDPAPESGPTS